MYRLAARALALLSAAVAASTPLAAHADDIAIVPLHEHAERHDMADRMSIRLVLDRCTALYTFASSTVGSRQTRLLSEYEAMAASFLAAARVATPEREVLLMLVLRMSNAYRRYASAQAGGQDPLALPLLQADLAYCQRYSATLKDAPTRKTAPP